MIVFLIGAVILDDTRLQSAAPLVAGLRWILASRMFGATVDTFARLAKACPAAIFLASPSGRGWVGLGFTALQGAWVEAVVVRISVNPAIRQEAIDIRLDDFDYGFGHVISPPIGK